MITELDLNYLRSQAVTAFAPWKQEIMLCDKVERGEWSILWPDQTVESSDPLIENIYAEALEDKTITAGAVLPMLLTQPTRGTRKDAGEKNASKRRRVGSSYWERSNAKKNIKRFLRDWLHTGMMAGSPWANGFSGKVLPANERFAYFEPVDPRSIYPLGWDSRGRLTSAIVMRQKRIADLEADWGRTHPALVAAKVRHAMKGWQLRWLEEVWFVDSTQWAVAICDSQLPETHQGTVFTTATPQGSTVIDWLVEPSLHNLGRCPLQAQTRVTVNDVPRGALLDIIPGLKLAQNFMARILDDLNASIYAPVILDNIQNPHEYGLGAVLVGTGQGKAFIDRDRPPVNFEAQQSVNSIMEAARRQAMEPQQRSGEPGASIVSSKGTIALMGTFNAELAAGQGDAEDLFADLTSVTAAFDEVHCPGLKEVWVLDANGKLEEETYDPAELYKGDYRFRVTYGDRAGLDENQYITRVAMVRNLEGMSQRSFMEKTGMVHDVLDEETEMSIAKLVTHFTDILLPQQIQAGDRAAMVKFWEAIDSDKKTAREAAFETLKETAIAPADQQGPRDPTSPGGRADILRLVRSMEGGGIPGQAAGQPASQLPADVGRMAANIAPGGGNAV